MRRTEEDETDLGLDLLKRSVEEPKEDVAPPEALLAAGRDLSDRPLVDIANLVRRQRRIPIRLQRPVGVLLETGV